MAQAIKTSRHEAAGRKLDRMFAEHIQAILPPTQTLKPMAVKHKRRKTD